MRVVLGFVSLLVACMDNNPAGVDYRASSFIGDIGQAGSARRSGPTITAVHFGGTGSAMLSTHFTSFDDMTAATVTVSLDTDSGTMTLALHPSPCGGGCAYFDCMQVSSEVDIWTAGDLDGSAAMDAGQGSCFTRDGGDHPWTD